MKSSAATPDHVLGARAQGDGTSFRVWAPAARQVRVELAGGSGARRNSVPLVREPDGHFGGVIAGIGPGALYRYRLDDADSLPDPCSRYQPEGPHGPSMVTDPGAYRWRDAQWQGITLAGQVIYELHIGTFTTEGTFDAASRELPELKALGVTAIEIMPVAECAGRWNWGYDGVLLYAPYHVYGDADALKRFVDAAHGLGLAVILDVVYNHLGPDGNVLASYSADYFTDRYANEWGQAINFDGPNSGPVRAYFVGNACHWIGQYHLDGLRLDATQSMHDASPLHIVAELTASARETAAATGRRIVVVAENEPQQIHTVDPQERGGHGLDGLWNDDFHHSARVAATGRHEGYFHDHRGHAQEFVSAVKRGFLFQGQHYGWQNQPRGSQVTDQPAAAFIVFTQNHDQVANTLDGRRLTRLTSPARNRTLTALLLLGPQTPMLFMGQEFAASTPFTFFADHVPDLARQVWAGRREFVAQFEPFASAEAQALVLDPAAESTFRACKLDFTERATHAPVYRLHRDLLALRRTDPVIAAQRRDAIDGAVLGDDAFILRWFDAACGDRLLLVNLGHERRVSPVPEPLLAPPRGHAWRRVWSSDDPAYDGPGITEPQVADGWRLPGESAIFLRAEARVEPPETSQDAA
ncbi:malto-oligosyltrehalose trehalohydrolase [Rhizobacter sp. LjRoot28]|uniref:malto-oligosyltrehalose trehalohydrolase n=1 Tax=Rhizobacter sp. LjRoot28 TaxID=3342309 RepID=UPI003ED12D3D